MNQKSDKTPINEPSTSIQAVKSYLKPFGRDEDVIELQASSATVELAAKALGTKPEHIAKTLSFYDTKGGCILLVAAGDAKVDNRKFKEYFGYKAKMLSFEDCKRLTGHEPGGVCPFANPDGTAVYLDISLKRFEAVYPACGSKSSAIRLTCQELETYSLCREWVDVCKGWDADSGQ